MKRILSTLVKAGISLALIALFLDRVSWGDIQAAATTANWKYLGLAVFLFTVSNLLGAVQWGVLLRQQSIRLPVRDVVTLYFVGVFFNNFMIGNIGGDAVRIYDLNRLTGKGVSGFAATFLDRFIGLFVMILFSIIAFAASQQLWRTSLGVPILILGAGLLGILSFGFSRRMSNWLLGVLEKVMPNRVIVLLEDIRQAFLTYRHAYGVLTRVGLVAVCVQICRICVYYSTGLALGQSVAFQHFLVFIPLIAIVAAVPISFGGIGVREQMGALLFGQVGVVPAIALAMMFLGYLAGILASLAGGIVFVLRGSGNGHPTSQEQAN